ncbi:MAG: formylglycine-generating enzyme family protein [Planctomycetota bacterium]
MTSESAGWERAATSADLTVWLPGEVPVYFQKLRATDEAGFRMGARGFDASEEPVHRVVIAEDFYLGTFPVTQAQYRALAVAGLDPSPSGFAGDLRPVEQVSWHHAEQWCQGLEKRWSGLRHESRDGSRVTVKRLGLPWEAEWEYACRAGTETQYCSGDGETALREVGWFEGNVPKKETQPVGRKAPNGWEIYDLHGSVVEWCADVYDANAYRKRPDGWNAREWCVDDAGKDALYRDDDHRRRKDPDRVLRGGSWYLEPWWCRSAFRVWWGPGNRYHDLSFRVCLVPGPAKPPAR